MKKIFICFIFVCSFCLANFTNIHAATAYEITKSDGALIRTSYSQNASEVRRAAYGSVIWVKGSIKNSAGNLWYQLSDGNWIYSGNVKVHSCSWKTTSQKSATCTSTGYVISECNKCYTCKQTTSSALGHNYSGNVCTRCNAFNPNSIKSKSSMNNVRYYVTKDGAAVHTGPYGACKTTHTLSKGTNITVTQKLVNASNNTWYLYSGGYIFSDYVVEHNSCKWNSGTVTKKATCTSTGIKAYQCTICGTGKSTQIAKTSHKYDGHVCTSCGGFDASSIKSTESINNIKYYVTKDSAAVHNGPYGACKTTQKLSKGTEIVVTKKLKNASKNIWYQYSGGYIFSDYVVEHNSCKWNSGTITKKATCTSTGTKTHKCSICGKGKCVTIAKTSHDYDNNVCTKCGGFKASSLKSTTTINNVKYVIIKADSKVHAGPYGACKTVTKLAKGTEITVTQKVENASNNVWYKYKDGYIFTDYVQTAALYYAKTSLNKSSAILYMGASETLKATVSGPSSKVTWKSSDSKIATVSSSGVVTPKKTGTVTISAKANGKTAKCKVTIKKLATPSNVSLSANSSGRKFTVKFDKVSAADGYQISYGYLGTDKNKTTTSTSTTISLDKENKSDLDIKVRAYKNVNGKKVYSNHTKTYKLHVHNAKSVSSTSYKTINYTNHTVTESYTCYGCKKKVKYSFNAEHSWNVGICKHCGEKQGANYVVGKMYPTVGDGPKYSKAEQNSKGKNPIYFAHKYSDCYFNQSTTAFSNDLCKLSSIGAAASYNKTFAKDFLAQCSFTNIKNLNSSSSASTTAKNKNDHARMTIGYKKSGTKTIVAVLINGYTSGRYEWISNFNVGTEGLHNGFSKAANELTDKINNYINSNNLNTGNIKIWLTGHSRGGAVTGMTAVNLNKTYGIQNVYAYGFATPNGVPNDINEQTNSQNIFNIVNPGDFVPYVVPTKWKFTKFGDTRNISMNATAKGYYKAMSNDSYNGLTTSEREELITAFKEYASSRKNYYKKKKYASPSDFGRALGIFLSDADNAEAFKLISKCVLDDLDCVDVLTKMIYDGTVTTKIHEAHGMETYIAMVYSKY